MSTITANTSLDDIFGHWLVTEIDQHVEFDHESLIEDMISHYDGEKNFMVEAEKRGITGGWANPVFHPLSFHDWDRLLPDAGNWLIADLLGDIDRDLEEDGEIYRALKIELDPDNYPSFDRLCRAIEGFDVVVTAHPGNLEKVCQRLGVEYSTNLITTLHDLFTRDWSSDIEGDYLFSDYIAAGLGEFELSNSLTSWYYDIQGQLN